VEHLLWQKDKGDARYGPDEPGQDLSSSGFCGTIHLESLRLSAVVVTYTLPQKERFRNFAFYSVFKVRNIGLKTCLLRRAASARGDTSFYSILHCNDMESVAACLLTWVGPPSSIVPISTFWKESHHTVFTLSPLFWGNSILDEID
jgi:hypothetical protein